MVGESMLPSGECARCLRESCPSVLPKGHVSASSQSCVDFLSAFYHAHHFYLGKDAATWKSEVDELEAIIESLYGELEERNDKG